MSYETKFPIPLFETGDDGSALRCKNVDDELQRKHISQQMVSDLMMQADLFSVVHGTLGSGGPATLIVIDFRFAGSRSQGRRFRKAIINVGFSRDGEPIGSALDPIVHQIAPFGTFAMDMSTTQEETKITGTASVSGAGMGLATIGIGAGFERRTTIDKQKYAMLNGVRWIEGRNEGEQNLARWILRENESVKNGIATFLRTAILVSPQTEDKFRAHVTISADVDIRYAVGTSVKKVLGKHIVDPVYFGAKKERKNLGPKLHDVDTVNLDACNLDALGVVKTVV